MYDTDETVGNFGRVPKEKMLSEETMGAFARSTAKQPQTKRAVSSGRQLAMADRSERKEDEKREGTRLLTPIILLVAVILMIVMIVVVLLVMLFQKPKGDVKPSQNHTDTQIELEAPAIETTFKIETAFVTEETTEPILEGWHSEGGRTYYYINGVRFTGDIELEDGTYYFDENGSPYEGWRDDSVGRRYYSGGKLQENTSITLESTTYYLAEDGYLSEVGLGLASATTSSDKFYFGNGMGGTTWVYYQILDEPVTNCTALTYQAAIRATKGNVEGTWVLCLRVNGQWQRIKAFEVVGEIAYTFAEFDEPIFFDAFTAYYSGGGTFNYNITQYLENIRTQYLHN